MVAGAVVALGAAPAATGATLEAPECVGADAFGTPTLPIEATGFVPDSFVSVRYEAAYLGEPRSAGVFRPDATGAFSADLVPPTLLRANRREATVRAIDPGRPEIQAAQEITVVRMRARIRPRRAVNPRRRVQFFTEGWEPGRAVYAHYTGPGDVVRTIRLGRAAPPCGKISRRMRLVPGRTVEPGEWGVDVDMSPTWSRSSRPQARTAVVVKRRD